MPAITDRLREGARDARDFIASRLDPRAAVRDEALKRFGVIRKLNGLLGGQHWREFNLEDPIYSGPVWNGPMHIEVIRRPDGFTLFVQTVEKRGNSPDSYGREMDIRGKNVGFFELPRTGNRIPFILHPTERPWDMAEKMVDRVVMATSNDPDVRGRYKAMREEEDRWQKQLVA